MQRRPRPIPALPDRKRKPDSDRQYGEEQQSLAERLGRIRLILCSQGVRLDWMTTTQLHSRRSAKLAITDSICNAQPSATALPQCRLKITTRISHRHRRRSGIAGKHKRLAGKDKSFELMTAYFASN
ncbi:hypothetical protein GCM10009565_84450 [Amycolatopsis albidoflavus]